MQAVQNSTSNQQLSAAERTQITEFIHSSCATLDREAFEDYLALFHPEARYEVVVYSPDIRKDMIWLAHDKCELTELLKMVPSHARQLGRYFRQSNVEQIQKDEGSGLFSVTSSVVVIYTEIDGSSRLFAVARYHDKVRIASDQMPLLVKRVVQLETRDLGTGSHLPI